MGENGTKVHKRRLPGVAAALAAAALLLAGCRGWIIVLKPSYEKQDQILQETLGRRYPKMEFTCADHPGNSTHLVRAADGTEFPVWIPTESQVMEYYREEWLRTRGYYDEVLETAETYGFSGGFHDYNHYAYHFQFECGEMTRPGWLEDVAAVLDFTRERFDQLYTDFRESTGHTEDFHFYLAVNFTLDGEEHFRNVYIAPPPEDMRWNFDYAYDDYAGYFDEDYFNPPEDWVPSDA